MPIVLDGIAGITTPEIVSTGGPLVLNASAPDNSVVVNASGNVGIGTASPGVSADIVNNVNNDNGQLRLSSSSGFGTRMTFVSTSTNGRTWQIGSNFWTGNGEFSIVDRTAAAERMRIDSLGNLLVGATSAGARLSVKGEGATGATRAMRVTNSADTEMFAILNAGEVYTGGAAQSPFNATTASAANVFVQSDGQLKRSTSSLKYKTDVRDAIHGLAEVMQLHPVTYKGANDGEAVFGGLIAEEVHEAGLTEFVQYAEDGSPDALAYGQMVSLAFKAIQELKVINDAQAQTINAQQTALESLTARVVALEN